MRGRVVFWLSLLLIATVACTAVLSLIRLLRTVPPPQLNLAMAAQLAVDPGTPPPLPLPPAGSLELTSSVDGRLADVAADQVRAVGSVAKTMTALVTLEAHPLANGQEGPSYVITANDVALYQQAVERGGSTVAVSVDERFTERQLLLALMLPSANNLAETLALWVDGSRDAFLAHLNARAKRLGMTQTHFDDPSGYSDSTVSTAADLVRLGDAVLSSSALAAIAATTSARMPDGATVENLDTNLGTQPGWLGIKTGSTNLAGGCLLFAAQRTPPGAPAPVRVVGAMLGQPTLDDTLTNAGRVAQAALSSYDSIDLGGSTPSVQASVATAWGSGSPVFVRPLAGTRLTVRKGAALELSSGAHDLTAPVAAGSTVATLTATQAGRALATWQVAAQQTVPEPSLVWRISHG